MSMKLRRLFSTALLQAATLAAGLLTAAPRGLPGEGRVERPPSGRGRIGRLELARVPFVENLGQLDRRVAFSAQTFFGVVFVTREGRLVYSLPATGSAEEGAERDRRTARRTLTETLLPGNPRPAAGTRAAAAVSYFRGKDPKRWQSGLPTYDEVRLGEVWRGVSVTLRATAGNVEKIFTVEPRARVEGIRVRLDGALSLRVDRDGALVATTANGEVRFTPPFAYQEKGRERSPIAVSYVVARNRYGFRLGPYDRTLPVVVDPLLQSTYLGAAAAATSLCRPRSIPVAARSSWRERRSPPIFPAWPAAHR